MSCSGVDDPRSTELTPSFLRHHAGKRRHGSGSQSTSGHRLAHKPCRWLPRGNRNLLPSPGGGTALRNQTLSGAAAVGRAREKLRVRIAVLGVQCFVQEASARPRAFRASSNPGSTVPDPENTGRRPIPAPTLALLSFHLIHALPAPRPSAPGHSVRVHPLWITLAS